MMPLLTRENLDQNSNRYADWQTVERGKSYYQSGRVELLEFDGQSATCCLVLRSSHLLYKLL
jgi:hypothetical protein